ncbi:MAG: hypothetical protein COA79_13835 [Planctomycetota bacterium]|nr:MAG: hypothetical protein COA79_13835 [Planctomycetota bacterium]
MLDLPKDLKISLENNFQFIYDIESSEIGKIELLSLNEIKLTNAHCAPHEDISDYDEYSGLEGTYLIPAYNLVKSSEDYLHEGLIAYFPTFKLYGSFNDDHEEVRLFRNTSWTTIINNPIKYLDEQWDNQSFAFQPTPWPGYDFQMLYSDPIFTIKGYPNVCEVHEEKIKRRKWISEEDLEYDITCDQFSFINEAQKKFPYSGQRISESFELRCTSCHLLKKEFIKNNSKPKVYKTITTNIYGFAKCPKCNSKFRFRPTSLNNGMHNCGQKLIIQYHKDFKKT